MEVDHVRPAGEPGSDEPYALPAYTNGQSKPEHGSELWAWVLFAVCAVVGFTVQWSIWL